MSAAAWRRRLIPFGFASGAALLLTGCWVYKAATAPVKLAATTVVVAGEAAGAVVSSTGRVAVSAAKAVGTVGGGGIDATTRLADSAMVTFVDAATGAIVRVPWREGMTLAAAGDIARISFAQRSIDVVRGGRLIYSVVPDTATSASLAPGDVVRLGN